MWKLWLQLPEHRELEEAVGTTRLGGQQQVSSQPCLPDQCDLSPESQEKRIYSPQCDRLPAVKSGSVSADPGSWSLCPDGLGDSGHAFFPNFSLALLWINHSKEKLNKHLERRLDGPAYGIQVETGFQGTPACVNQIKCRREPSCTETPCQGPIHTACLVNRMPSRGSWMLLPAQKAMLWVLLPPDPKENSQNSQKVHVAHNGDAQETGASKSKVKPLEAEDDNPAVPAPGSLDSSLSALGQRRLLEAVTHLWPLGLVLAKSPLSPRGFQRTLLLQACLQLSSYSSSRFGVSRGQFCHDGITSIRARPQASINLHMKKSPLSHARTIPEGREAGQGLNLIQNEKFCPLGF